jgi:hypothetical protein
VRAIAVAAAAVVLGCHSPLTEAVITTDTDLAIPHDVDTVRWTVDATEIGGHVHAVQLPVGAQTRLPVVLPVVHEGGPLGPIVVVAQGLSGGAPVISRTARFYFVPKHSIVVSIDLARDCIGVACELGQTCVDGACAASEVPADAGPAPTDAATHDAAGSPRDAGNVDAHEPVPDAEPVPDGGPLVCMPDCPCDQSCVDASCQCKDGCGCALSCVGADADCEEMTCDGEGVECRVVARDASNVEAKCEHRSMCTHDIDDVSNFTLQCKSEARCDVACVDVSNCRVECSGGAVCRLSCMRSSECEYTRCDGVVTVCLDGARVCNGPCP